MSKTERKHYLYYDINPFYNGLNETVNIVKIIIGQRKIVSRLIIIFFAAMKHAIASRHTNLIDRLFMYQWRKAKALTRNRRDRWI